MEFKSFEVLAQMGGRSVQIVYGGGDLRIVGIPPRMAIAVVQMLDDNEPVVEAAPTAQPDPQRIEERSEQIVQEIRQQSPILAVVPPNGKSHVIKAVTTPEPPADKTSDTVASTPPLGEVVGGFVAELAAEEQKDLARGREERLKEQTAKHAPSGFAYPDDTSMPGDVPMDRPAKPADEPEAEGAIDVSELGQMTKFDDVMNYLADHGCDTPAKLVEKVAELKSKVLVLSRAADLEVRTRRWAEKHDMTGE